MKLSQSSTIAVYERMWAFMDTAEPSVFVLSNEDGVTKVRLMLMNNDCIVNYFINI